MLPRPPADAALGCPLARHSPHEIALQFIHFLNSLLYVFVNRHTHFHRCVSLVKTGRNWKSKIVSGIFLLLQGEREFFISCWLSMSAAGTLLTHAIIRQRGQSIWRIYWLSGIWETLALTLSFAPEFRAVFVYGGMSFHGGKRADNACMTAYFLGLLQLSAN